MVEIICTDCGKRLTEAEAAEMWVYSEPRCFQCFIAALEEQWKTPALEEFEVMLKRHDWAFNYADHAAAYDKGLSEEREIRWALNNYTGAQKAAAEALYEKYKR